MLNQTKISKVSALSGFSLVGWVGWWVEKTFSAPSDFGFKFYSPFFNFHAKLNWTEIDKVRGGVISAGIVGWAGKWGDNPNPFKL